MRHILLAVLIACWLANPALAVISVDLPNECSDRNSLQGMAYDARLIAIKLYYKGFIDGLADKKTKTCLEAHVLLDDRFAVVNRTREIIEEKCLPIDVAASMATKGLCP
ncbi:MAG TPA: hypothetical protein VFE63_08675 [Roseiarcus sp.]|nr:hypothetical protein [Roseiarcus sp.]